MSVEEGEKQEFRIKTKIRKETSFWNRINCNCLSKMSSLRAALKCIKILFYSKSVCMCVCMNVSMMRHACVPGFEHIHPSFGVQHGHRPFVKFSYQKIKQQHQQSTCPNIELQIKHFVKPVCMSLAVVCVCVCALLWAIIIL